MTLELECLEFILRVARGQEDCVMSHNIDDAEKTLRMALTRTQEATQ